MEPFRCILQQETRRLLADGRDEERKQTDSDSRAAHDKPGRVTEVPHFAPDILPHSVPPSRGRPYLFLAGYGCRGNPRFGSIQTFRHDERTP